jgi:hypothetical protein
MASATIEAIINGDTATLLVVAPHYDTTKYTEFKANLKIISGWFEAFNSDGSVRTLHRQFLFLNLSSLG